MIMNSRYKMHSMICRAFRGQAPTLAHTVDHIDNDPSNNNVENFRWLTRSEQINHSYATNSSRKSSAPSRSKPVQGRKLGDDEWTSYDSAQDAARKLHKWGLKPGNISRVCGGKRKQTGGYEFRFDDTKGEADTLLGEEWRDVVMCKAVDE
jgi:hypothetical protein